MRQAPKGVGGGHAAVLPTAELLQDLCSRFVLNCPAEELQSFERILFLVEQVRARALRARAAVVCALMHLGCRRQAHWFYEDFCRVSGTGPALKSFSLREFADLMFAQHPSLERHKVLQSMNWEVHSSGVMKRVLRAEPTRWHL